jgi:hypothetical protein
MCAHHARQERRHGRPDDEALAAAELLASIEDFSSASSVDRFLGNIVRQFARKRIDRLDAVALTYMSQMLLNSLSAMEREELQDRPLVW